MRIICAKTQSFKGLFFCSLKPNIMETSQETLIGLLASKELELAEMRLYATQLENNYNDLVSKYNNLLNKLQVKEKRTPSTRHPRTPVGYRRGGQG